MYNRVSTDTIKFNSANSMDVRGYYNWTEVTHGLRGYKSRGMFNELVLDRNNKCDFIRSYPTIF